MSDWTTKLWVYCIQRLFRVNPHGRYRSEDLLKLGPMILPLLIGVDKLEPDGTPRANGNWLNQIAFSKNGLHYSLRMKHLDRELGLPRRIELVRWHGNRALPIIYFSTLADAEAWSRNPHLAEPAPILPGVQYDLTPDQIRLVAEVLQHHPTLSYTEAVEQLRAGGM